MSNHEPLPQAVIMAGGRGVRLRPLTLDVPKPLQPLLGKPTIFYLLELLKRHGYSSATVTIGYRPERMVEALADYSELSINLVKEETPLGTAGGVRLAWDGESDVLTLSGDGLCDFDLTAAWAFFKAHDCDALIVTRTVDDPREYGLVETDANGRILSFKEKPAFSACSCDTANTGVYILSKRLLSTLSVGETYDFGSELFPSLLQNGSRLYALPQSGYWCDMGDVDGYIRCQSDLLNGRIRDISAPKGGIFSPHSETKASSGYKINPPVFIGRRVKIGVGSVIGENTVLEDDVTIGSGCEISGSIIGRGSMVNDGAVLIGMVCGTSSTVSQNARAESGSILGSHAILGENCVLTAKTRVYDNLIVEDGFILRSDLIKGQGAPIQFGEDGISGACGVEITPQVCAALGSGLAALCEKGAVGIGCSSGSAAGAFSHSVTSGVMAAGENVWSFGVMPLSFFEFCLQKSGLSIGVYVDGGRTTTLHVLSRAALPLSRKDERILESALNHAEYRRASAHDMGSITDLCGLKKLYRVELLKSCDFPLNLFSIHISSSSETVSEIMREVLSTLSANVLEEQSAGSINVTISSDGKQVSIQDEKGVRLSHEQLLALCCLFEFKRGENVSLPCKAPAILDEIAKSYGCKIWRYAECPCSNEDSAARQKAASKPYLRDGLLLLIKVLSSISGERLTLSEAASLLPLFVTTERIVSFTSTKSSKPVKSGKEISALLRQLQKVGSETAVEGFTIRKENQSAYFRPLKSGKGVAIYTQGNSTTQASETADLFEQLIMTCMDAEKK